MNTDVTEAVKTMESSAKSYLLTFCKVPIHLAIPKLAHLNLVI
jgi:hypothetical protein